MRIKVVFQMSAYIEANSLDVCKEIWEDYPLNKEEQLHEGHIGLEYDQLLDVVDADTLEDINHQNW